MARRSPLDYDVSVAADKQRRTRARGMTGAFDTKGKICEWEGCEAPAAYRAPRSPERLDEFRWFCLEHVREYNARWDFFANKSESEVEEILRGGTIWERPTWSLGRGAAAAADARPHANGRAWARFGYDDPLDILGAAATISPGAAEGTGERPRRRLSREEQAALDTLGVAHQVTARREVRAAYRALVKELHPDMNGGENPDPGRLARVLKAWEVLRKSPNFED